MAYEVDFDEKATNINEDYTLASKLVKQGQRLEGVDEMSGIHALERKHPYLLIIPGKVEQREF